MYKLAAFILNFDFIFVNVKLIFYELFSAESTPKAYHIFIEGEQKYKTEN
jgi:hypothetical protein